MDYWDAGNLCCVVVLTAWILECLDCWYCFALMLQEIFGKRAMDIDLHFSLFSLCSCLCSLAGRVNFFLLLVDWTMVHVSNVPVQYSTGSKSPGANVEEDVLVRGPECQAQPAHVVEA